MFIGIQKSVSNFGILKYSNFAVLTKTLALFESSIDNVVAEKYLTYVRYMAENWQGKSESWE